MKNILKGMLLPVLAMVAIPMMTSCSEDRDSNPTLQEASEFVLNTPAIALGGNTYDLAKAQTLTLTCSQPNYGYTAPVIYQVQVSVDPQFDKVDKDGVAYTTLSANYTTAKMEVDGVELNNAVVKLYQNAHQGADPSGIDIPVYIRLRAHVDKTENSYINSNVIELPHTQVSYVASLPTNMYMKSSSIRGGAEATQLGPVYGSAGQYYGIIYMAAGASLTWGDDDTAANGYINATVDDQANAGVSEAADGGIQFANAGWYTVHTVSVVDAANNRVDNTIHIYPAQAYIIGAAAGGDWTDGSATWAMTAPADPSESWESPAFAGGGELRAYIHVPGLDWWKTEFTLYQGKLYWRVDNIVNSWAENVGAAYSVTCNEGQKLYVNFDYNTGEVK